MEKTHAIQTAIHFASEQGYNVSLYQVRASVQGGHWQVQFQRRLDSDKPSPGDFFTVLVNSATATVQAFFPGK
ncbi:hypothetical protein [Almyronema epifaneia]|uniref:PepSY domain-containing protein n=1 Tax=Almyronema epifaneia S1 TaxID=2991925 RepID=A0ABW6IFJ1_9CYAN